MKILSPPRKSPFAVDYWYLHGASKEHQFIVSFGTSKTGGSFNGHSVKYPRYGAVFWGAIGDEKRVGLEGSFKLSFPPKEPFVFKRDGSGYLFEFEKTRIHFGKEYAKPLEAKVFLTRLRNEYREFSGKLFGRTLKGKSYVQKVELRTPLLSWDWLRFSGKHSGDLFKLPWQKNAVLKFDNQEYVVNLKAFDGNQILFSDKVYLTARPYAYHPIIIRARGKLHYNQYLVRVEGRVEGAQVKALGTTEVARGFVF